MGSPFSSVSPVSVSTSVSRVSTAEVSWRTVPSLSSSWAEVMFFSSRSGSWGSSIRSSSSLSREEVMEPSTV